VIELKTELLPLDAAAPPPPTVTVIDEPAVTEKPLAVL
jgi:hypothetical protein